MNLLCFSIFIANPFFLLSPLISPSFLPPSTRIVPLLLQLSTSTSFSLTSTVYICQFPSHFNFIHLSFSFLLQLHISPFPSLPSPRLLHEFFLFLRFNPILFNMALAFVHCFARRHKQNIAVKQSQCLWIQENDCKMLNTTANEIGDKHKIHTSARALIHKCKHTKDSNL